MRHFLPALPVLLAALLTGPALAAAEPVFRAELTGDQEFPGPGHPTAKGTFRITFLKGLTEARFTLSVIDLPGTTRAHLHCAPAGAAGPIFIHLIGDMPTNPRGAGLTEQNINGPWLRSATLTDQSFSNITTTCGDSIADLAAAIEAGTVYVNVHTNALPAGAIRGQLHK